MRKDVNAYNTEQTTYIDKQAMDCAIATTCIG